VLFLELWELLDKDVLTRRLIIHESIYDKVKDAVVAEQLSIGNPLDENNRWTANRY
jgi:acyl-CoA reductase-like NAD-dependent aldehyde dehydrogenase